MKPFKISGQNLAVLSALSLIGLSHSLPLNFRFSPRFDYSEREDNKHVKAVPHAKKQHAHSSVHKYPTHRRYPRSVSVDDKLNFLKARLAALKEELASRQSQNVNHDIDSGVQFDQESKDKDETAAGKVDWPAKLHNKHIFARTVQILGAFPKAFPEPPVYQVAAAKSARATAKKKASEDTGAISADMKITDDRKKLLDLKRKRHQEAQLHQQQQREEQEAQRQRSQTFDQPKPSVTRDEMTDENVMLSETPF